MMRWNKLISEFAQVGAREVIQANFIKGFSPSYIFFAK